MLTRSASYSDRETAQWATQQVVTANEQVIHRWLAQGTRPRLTIEAAWPLAELDPAGSGPRLTSITGKIFCGHFERRAKGTRPLAENVDVRIERFVQFSEFDVDARATGDGTLEYLCFGHGSQLYLAHAISAAPSFDQILEVHAVPGTATSRMGEPLPDDTTTMDKFFREHFTTAAPCHIGGRSNDPDHRLASQEVADGSFFATSPPSGFRGFDVQLEADREVYLEVRELAGAMH